MTRASWVRRPTSLLGAGLVALVLAGCTSPVEPGQVDNRRHFDAAVRRYVGARHLVGRHTHSGTRGHLPVRGTDERSTADRDGHHHANQAGADHHRRSAETDTDPRCGHR